MVTGGTSMSLNYFDSSTFVVGTEGGQIHKCVLPRFSIGWFFFFYFPKISADFKKSTPTNCISFNYEEHIGPVNYIHFSPFHRNVFLSGGSDTNLRIYNLLKVILFFFLFFN
jgi:WD40 repeat protein